MDQSTDLNSKPDDGVKTFAELSSVMAEQSFVMDNSVLAPVEIEELDPASFKQMNFDMNEFVEAKAIKIQKMPQQLSVSAVQYVDYSQPEEAAASDAEEQHALSPEEENRLTKQFLNGELTFSEYTVRMDRDIEAEEVETR